MATAAVKVMRAASIVLCLIVIASFLLFAVNQTSTASGKQQEVLGSKPVAAETAKSTKHESSARQTLDETAEALTSPVDGLSSSEWGERSLRLIFALLVYGFALGFLARALRVRS
jgi:hypothetical protein